MATRKMTRQLPRRVPRLLDLRVAGLPFELPVFPIAGALLLPGGKLPLNVFEPRYLALIEDVLSGDRLFGMIQPSVSMAEPDPETADEPDTGSDDASTPLFGVGCVGRLSSFAERQDGTCSISLTGLARFRVRHEIEGLHGYRRLAVNYEGFEKDLDQVGEIDFDREGLLESLRRYFTHRGFDARWEAIEQMDDETLLTTLSMICPLPPAEKQALLEAPTLADRARTLQALLEMAGHETEDGGKSHAV
ncbi:peptidase [Lichenicola cladoniae]|uniref:Peptidase n=1 Tax=Lichenicola cladoniae TaxID=1484109 RepID=A0A6M8HUA3_9PROT|nr:LON peptidase substrate-binding domain-containing protein [Lichenicola cladoniae]NPD67610.1 peptidase [Acetobacteraceae bacterium]QKE91747.1 peptidase [Lichenicola cladoniae]